jgi:hypothetical protein
VDLTRSFSAVQFTRALEWWAWAGVPGKQPLFTSPFGDVFLQAPDGFWFLDLLEGALTRPWPDAGATARGAPPASPNMADVNGWRGPNTMS